MAFVLNKLSVANFACIVTFSLVVASAAAGPFTDLIIFGDSLSDVGNVQSAFSSFPGPYYHEGRFSNGPVYAEALAAGLGLPALTRSTAGGGDFAYGGAKTSGTAFPISLVVRDVDDQVDRFLATRTADAGALFVVFAGANDLIDGQTNVNIPAANLADDIERLITVGARQFLVANLPPLGETPRFNSNTMSRAQYNTRSASFNAALDTRLDSIGAADPALSIFRLDVAALFTQAIASPAAFGLTNVTQAAAPGLEPGASSYDTNQIAPNANEYLFWDDLHPTATVHAHLAQAALKLFALPGDFNVDGAVDTADYVVWRGGFGMPYTQHDYETWRANFGRVGGSGASTTARIAVGETSAAEVASVPEPVTLCLLAFAALAATMVAPRRRWPD